MAPRPSERQAAAHRALVRLLMSPVREMGFGPEEVERFGAGQGAAIVRPGGGIGEVTATLELLDFGVRDVEGASRRVRLAACAPGQRGRDA